MENPFNLTQENLIELLSGYNAWIKSDPKEAGYPEVIREQSKKIKSDFLNPETLQKLNDDDLHDKIYKYSRNLEGRVHRTLGGDILRTSINELRGNLMYIMTSKDSPFIIAQNILEGTHKIKSFAKAFWSPILLAQFPGVLPNWNNKTEAFLNKLGINITTSKLSIAEKYQRISEAFTFLSGVNQGHDFYTINHLMHYGTAVKEGSDLILRLQGKMISDPVAELIRTYKAQIMEIGLKDELYKWELIKKYRGRPDTKAEDFYNEIVSIDFKNLVFYNAVRVKKHIASKLPEEYRSCFEKLFDEKEDLTKRVKDFIDNILIVYRKVEGQQGSHHDERTTAAFLTFHDPLKYTFFKDSFYRKYCTLIGVHPKAKGEKYSHYLELVSDLIKRYISPDKELIDLVNSFMEAECFDDPNHLLLAQDILFQMLDKNDEEEDDKTDLEEEPTDYANLKTNMNNTALNTILYGPPGTGKTYNTINRALQIVNPGFDLSQPRKIVKDEFNCKVAEGRIVFTTFHQSMSYEDFVEGIKPQEPKVEGHQISYKVEDGIFKKLCQKANSSFGNIENVIEDFKKEISEVDGKQPISIKAKGTSFDVVYRGTNVFYVQPHASIKDKPWYPVNIDNILKVFKTEDFTGVYNPTYVREIINFLERNRGLKKGQDENNIDKPFVLIIDEINRGNISQIFGELITLIEEDKRLGNDEALEALLPYSKEKFGVPANLYIIGTMNTADRSVEALDTALRRRFSFEEMSPRYDLIELSYDIAGTPVGTVLKTINKRIEKLLDKDHAIGHSYFIKKEDETPEVKWLNSFYQNIIPLLEEYFFGDFGKIGLVLGQGFVKKKEWVKESDSFAGFDYESSAEFEDRSVYEIIDYRKIADGAVGFVKAIRMLMNEKVE
jgi:5-methylcytosine-specific restriction protein B